MSPSNQWCDLSQVLAATTTADDDDVKEENESDEDCAKDFFDFSYQTLNCIFGCCVYCGKNHRHQRIASSEFIN